MQIGAKELWKLETCQRTFLQAKQEQHLNNYCGFEGNRGVARTGMGLLPMV